MISSRVGGTAWNASELTADKKVKAAQDFETILVSGLLGKMYDTVAPDGGTDPGADTLCGVAVQAVSEAVVKAGGFGIARLLVQHLPDEGRVEGPGDLPKSQALKTF